MSHPVAGLPERVTVYEVGPRDGLQNESAIVPVEAKAEFVRRLVAAGLPVVEATSSSTRGGCPSWPTRPS
jgi:hydroxymethylglutaryl-CoA lyase